MKKDYFFSLLFSAILLLLAWAADAYLPRVIIVSSLYAIPVLITASRFEKKITGAVSLITVVVYLTESYLEQTLFLNWFLGLLGLVIIIVLSIQLSEQRMLMVQRAKEIERSRKDLRLFMNSISHDLAQPITSIKLYLQLLSRKEKVDKTIMDQAMTSLDQADGMIEDLKEVARIGNGSIKMNKGVVDLGALLKSVANQQQAQTKAHKIKVEYNSEVKGQWDEQRLTRLFNNLISNAIKYSPSGGLIKVKTEKYDNRVVISVSDEGIGIPSQKRDQLFQPFSRLHSRLAIKGSGLGLYISKAIVDLHNGNVWVESKKGKGSTFFVELPLKKTGKNRKRITEDPAIVERDYK